MIEKNKQDLLSYQNMWYCIWYQKMKTDHIYGYKFPVMLF